VNPRRLTNLPASVRQKLRNLARERKEEFGLVLTRYGIERLLYRISESEYRDQFVVKGATLFALWTGEPHRATRDLDLLGVGDASPGQPEKVFRALCKVRAEDDGLEFDASSVRVGPIREQQAYGGVRVEFQATLGVARIHLQVDVAYGDAVTPKPKLTLFPTLLELPAPRLRAYPKESVVAEKLHSLVQFGIANSRMKDFYDIWVLSRTFEFDGGTLTDAVKATFQRRQATLPERAPLALTPAFADDGQKNTQWAAFVRKAGPQATAATLHTVVAEIARFTKPIMDSARKGSSMPFNWPPGGPWK
jgi:predicted nucleotidyltransferase component of viral defense system